ncbi:527_t:CDS:2 [Gigaspora rosea]|nr:527_t:CDS:2 [Gigaspora rosea]
MKTLIKLQHTQETSRNSIFSNDSSCFSKTFLYYLKMKIFIKLQHTQGTLFYQMIMIDKACILKTFLYYLYKNETPYKTSTYSRISVLSNDSDRQTMLLENISTLSKNANAYDPEKAICIWTYELKIRLTSEVTADFAFQLKIYSDELSSNVAYDYKVRIANKIYFPLAHSFASRLIKGCNEIIRDFKKSHQLNAYLQQAIHELNIPGGGLRKFIDTRWTSAYECTLSISQLEFKILSSIQTAFMNLEAQLTTIADCFVQSISLAAAIKKIPSLRINEFKNYCKQDIMQFQEIAKIVIHESYDEYECANLIAYMRLFQEKEDEFAGYMENDDADFFISAPSYGTRQVASATFLVEDNKRIIEDFEVEEVEESEYSGSDSDNEGFQDYDDEFDELDYDELTGNKRGQGVFDFDSAELATNLVSEWVMKIMT